MGRTKSRTTHLHHDRLTPPECLSDGAKTAFCAIVNAVDRDHFTAVDVPLVAEYARAIDLANQAAAKLEIGGAVGENGKPNAWLTVQEKCVRAIVALCARLRLSPQSRYDRLVAGTNSRPQHRPPWDDDDLLAGPDDGPRNPKPKHGLASFR